MPNRWITFVKKWSSENNVSYGCALTKPEMKAEYHKLYPKVVKVKTKGVAKLEESRPPADVKSKVTYPNLSIRIPPQQENIQFDIQEDMDDEPQPRSKKGRPAKYMTEDEKYKAKLESNKQKRREKAAAKKSQSQAGLEESIPNVNPKNISMKGIEIKKPYVAPVKASKKVFADPNLMRMIEGFKPTDKLDVVLDTLTDKHQVSMLYYILKQLRRFKIKGFMPSQTIINFSLHTMYQVKLPSGKEVNLLSNKNIYGGMEDAVNKLFDTPEFNFRINISKEGIKAYYFWKGEEGARGQQEFYNNAYQTKIAPIMDDRSWVKRWNELDVIRQAKKLSEKERIDEEERDARKKKQIINDKMYPIAEKLIEDLKFKINFGYNNTKDQKVSKLVRWIRNRNIWELTEKQRDEYRELERLIELEGAIPYRHSWKETKAP
jgi:hypothetical protein